MCDTNRKRVIVNQSLGLQYQNSQNRTVLLDVLFIQIIITPPNLFVDSNALHYFKNKTGIGTTMLANSFSTW